MGLKNKLGEQVGVIVMDMQKCFLDYYSSSTSKKESQIMRYLNENAKRMIYNQERIIAKCAEENVPLFFVKYGYKEDPLTNLTDAAIKVSKKYLIEKEEDDGFIETWLDDCLRHEKVQTILFMGINSGTCVKETAKTALRKIYKISTGEGLVLDFKEYKHKRAVEWYSEKGIWLKEPMIELTR